MFGGDRAAGVFLSDARLVTAVSCPVPVRGAHVRLPTTPTAPPQNRPLWARKESGKPHPVSQSLIMWLRKSPHSLAWRQNEEWAYKVRKVSQQASGSIWDIVFPSTCKFGKARALGRSGHGRACTTTAGQAPQPRSHGTEGSALPTTRARAQANLPLHRPPPLRPLPFLGE